MSTTGDSWIRRLRPASEPRSRLVCFPPEGASATFFLQLAQSIARPVEVLGVQYPGRRDRRHEPSITSVTGLADGVATALRSRVDLPLALLGNGLGSAVAFETAVRAERAGHQPLALFVSGAPAPPRLGAPAVDTDEFTQPARSPAPTPLETLRDDRTAAETYRWQRDNRVSCHVLAMVEDTDPAAERAAAWGEVTSGQFELQVFSGGHDYLTSFVSTVANMVSERITALSDR
ncbi:thioesterase II family protein [Actinokineospora inagensis]|uniref:thioesterase II family protein n=1 Tax=Actinokineospora inagensis TaxID=103730 RepID=UPI000404F508|nr:thioesterase domain-containing protein [Actinokineospora inagensis]